MVWIMDRWSVHNYKYSLDLIKQNLNILLIFVLVNCINEFQPTNVIL